MPQLIALLNDVDLVDVTLRRPAVASIIAAAFATASISDSIAQTGGMDGVRPPASPPTLLDEHGHPACSVIEAPPVIHHTRVLKVTQSMVSDVALICANM